MSSAEYWRTGDVVDVVRRLFPKADVEIGPGPVPELDLQGPFDTSTARRDLGFVSGWPLERGLARYAEWLADHDA